MKFYIARNGNGITQLEISHFIGYIKVQLMYDERKTNEMHFQNKPHI
jgi:hypothetical protein